MPATRNIQWVHVVFVRDNNDKYRTFRSDVPNSASATPKYSEHFLFFFSLSFSSRNARLRDASVVRCMVSDAAARSAVLCSAVWNLRASSYEWSWHEIDRCLVYVLPELLSWHWSSAPFDCQRFWHRLIQIMDHVTNRAIKLTVQRQSTRSLITKSLWRLVGFLLPDHCRCRALFLHLITHRHTHTHTHLVGFLWKSDQLVVKAANYTTHNKQKRRTSMPSAGFEPAIPATGRPQSYASNLMTIP